ncbi:hypothetical protein TNCV_998001 [Trichonephila clavipes]|nr:hypothetical protein TNCV_998001 [Trichonephila clavipes]
MLNVFHKDKEETFFWELDGWRKLGKTSNEETPEWKLACAGNLGYVSLRLSYVCSPERTSEREDLHFGRRTEGRCEGQGLVTATGNPGIRNPSIHSPMESLCSGL